MNREKTSVFKVILRCVIGGVFFVYTLAFVEWMIWVHASSYPLWLTSPLETPAPVTKLSNGNLELFEKVCTGKRGMMSIDKRDNGYFMRCDTGISLTSWKHGVYHLTEKNVASKKD